MLKKILVSILLALSMASVPPATLAGSTPDGLVKTFYENGMLKEEKNYRNGKLHGGYRAYYEDGRVKQAAFYQNGVLQDMAKSFFPSGKVKLEITYDKGLRQGIKKEYAETNGNIVSEERFDKDKLEGDSLLIDPGTGRIIVKTTYARGLREGWEIFYQKSGAPWMESQYKEGKRNGIYRMYAPNGLLNYQYHYANDKKEGKGIIYDIYSGAPNKIAAVENYRNDERVS